MGKPTFVGVGAQKCATTWIHSILSDHPEVTTPGAKELDFFSYYFDRGFLWYESFFDDSRTEIMGEISPSYLCDPRAPERLYNYNSDLRIIVSLRDPVERAYSNHLHEVKKNHLPEAEETSFELGLRNNPMYIYQSLYGKHLSNFLSIFPRSQILVLFSEDIALNPRENAARVYEFVGVDAHHESRFLRERNHKSVRTRSAMVKAIVESSRGVAGKFGLGHAFDLLRHSKVGGAAAELNRVDLRQEVPPMLPTTREALVDLFAEDVKLLTNCLEVTVAPWASWRTAGRKNSEMDQDLAAL